MTTTVPPLAALDVRPLIAAGTDPRERILAVVEALPPGGALLLEAPFRPAPLLALLSRRGDRATAEALASDHWLVEIVRGGAPEVVDLRELEPPEPLERVLLAVAALAPGGVYLARMPRVPRLLFPRLHGRGLDVAVLERPDGAALLRISRQT